MTIVHMIHGLLTTLFWHATYYLQTNREMCASSRPTKKYIPKPKGWRNSKKNCYHQHPLTSTDQPITIISWHTHTHIYIYTYIYTYIYSSQTHPKKNQGLQFSHCGATNSQGAERPELSGGGVWRRRPWRSLVGWFLRGIMEMHHSSFTIEWNWYHGISWQSVRQKFNYPHESEQQWAIQLFQPTWTSSGTWVIANRWKMISLYVTIGWYQPTFPHSPIKSQRMWEEFNIETSH